MSEEQERQSLSEQVLELWKKDSEFDRYSPADESAKVSKLHYKYLNLYRQCSAKIIELSQAKSRMYLKKSNFYGGKDSPDVYREKNFHLKVLKADMDTYIKADDQFAKLISRIEEYEMTKDILKSILDQIKNRHWIAKNIIEHDRFTSGG